MSTAAPPPALRLFGVPALQVGGRFIPFAAERPALLLLLLACRRQWVGRDELADLLYPGRDLPAARSNLRKVLHLARQQPGAEVLEQQGDLLRWVPDSDLARFEAACADRRHDEALALYGGPLLHGLDSAWPPDAAEWLHAERQRLHARWHESALRQLAALQSRPDAAIELAQTLLRADPLDETALQALGRAQQALGQPSEALAALTQYERRLSNSVGLQPSVAVRTLGESLRGQHTPPATTGGLALVGRRQELQLIEQRLAEPQCRVLTMLGGAGSGKSTLARAVQARQPTASLWVPLEDCQQGDTVAERIATLSGLKLDPAQSPWPALAHALAARPLLLVLDNAEHLDLAAAVEGLLAACPGVRLLVASRTPLGVTGEWRLHISGLPLPDPDETDPEVLRANDAVQLFELRARPLAPAFDLRAEAADVVRLVHEVEGLPLAIELLAAWRRLMPVREILAELAESLDVLEPTAPHERSVRASFARAWQQLGPVEQQVLAGMAVLPGPLDRAQVRNVLQAPLPVMAALADRSLLRADDEGTYSLHPLIRRCAAPLAQDVPALRERHARQLMQRLNAGDTQGTSAAHLLAAWDWAQEQLDTGLLIQICRVSLKLAQTRSEREQWLLNCQAVHPLLLAAEGPPASEGAGTAQRQRLQALYEVTASWTQLEYLRGGLDRSDALALEALDWARRLDDPARQAMALLRRSSVAWQRGDYEAALAFNDEALLLERQAGIPETSSGNLGFRALFLKGLGRYDDALEVQQRLLAATRQRGELHHSLYLMNNLGNLLRLLRRSREALDLLHEGLQVARVHGRKSDVPFFLTNLALAHESLRETDIAERWAGEAVKAARESGEPMIEAAALLVQARLKATARRPADEALAPLREALQIAVRLSAQPLTVQCLSSVGVVLARQGRRAEGLAMVRWAQRQASFARSEREDAERHLATMGIDPVEETAALRLLPPSADLQQTLAWAQELIRPQG